MHVRIRFLAALLCFCTSMAFASTSIADSGKAVSGIAVSGLKKTRQGVIDDLLKRYIGKPASEVSLKEVETTLRETGLFEAVKVSFAENAQQEPILAVEIVEKWTLIPLPMFMSTSGKIAGGVFVMDANAFGLNDKAMLGGIFSTASWMAMGSYSRLPRDDAFGWMVSAFLSRGTKTIEDNGENTLLEYDATSIAATAGLSWAAAHWALFRLDAGFRTIEVKGGSPDSIQTVSLALGLDLRRSDWDGWFLSQRLFSVKPEWEVSLEGNAYPSITARGSLEQSIVPRLRLISSVGGYWGPNDEVTMLKGQREAGVAILPSDFASPKLAGISAGGEIGVWKMKYGTVSARMAWQAVVAEDAKADTIVNHGPLLGTRFYIAKIAFPAVDIGGCYNVNTQTWQVNFGIGFSM